MDLPPLTNFPPTPLQQPSSPNSLPQPIHPPTPHIIHDRQPLRPPLPPPSKLHHPPAYPYTSIYPPTTAIQPPHHEPTNIDILAAAASTLAVAENTPDNNNNNNNNDNNIDHHSIWNGSVSSRSLASNASTPRVSTDIERSSLVQKKRHRLRRRYVHWPRSSRKVNNNIGVVEDGGDDGKVVGGGNKGMLMMMKGSRLGRKVVVSDDVMVAEFKVRDEKDRRVRRRKPRVVWSEKLHARFVTAVELLGVEQAVPRAVLQLMNVRNLTRENVASHLQKYRNSLKEINRAREERKAGENGGGRVQEGGEDMEDDDRPILMMAQSGSEGRQEIDGEGENQMMQ